MTEENPELENKTTLKDRITGTGQQIIGQLETIGGVLTGDPITRAEGEFNVEVGEIRNDVEEDLGELAEND